MINWIKALLPVTALLLVFACGDIERQKLVDEAPLLSISLEDATGNEIVWQTPPERIISLAPSITESIFAIDGQDKLLARSSACDRPDDVLNYEAIRLFPSLDTERLFELSPDALLMVAETFPSELIQMINEKGIPVLTQSYGSWDDIYQGITNLGVLLEKEEEAQKLNDSLRTVLKRIVDQTQNEVKYRTAILVRAEPLTFAGGIGLLDQLITDAGATHVFADVEEEYVELSSQEVIQAQIEYLIIPTDNSLFYTELIAKYPELTNTPADYNKQVYLVDPATYFRPGPGMLEAQLELTRILHNKLNRDLFVKPLNSP